MKNNNKKNVLIISGIIVFVLIIVICILTVINSKQDKYKNIKNSMEKVFFYLDKDEYEKIDEMSDFCKIALIYDSSYMKKESSNRYSKDKFMRAIRSILGNDVNFNFNLNELDTYNFLMSDTCLYSNPELGNLSYDSSSKQIYIDNKNNDEKINNSYYLQVSWDKPIENGNLITLRAKALLIEKNDNSYNIYADLEKNESLGEYKSLKEARKYAEKSMYYSVDYEFTLENKNGNLIWKSFKKNKVSSDTIID